MEVQLYGERVGQLALRAGTSTFDFDGAYLDSSIRPVLGQTFEERPRARWRQVGRLPRWFSNVLPEPGPLLDFLLSELELRPTNEAELLNHLGTDLPGAVTVVDVDKPSAGDESLRDEIAEEDLDSEPVVRFSAAGIQLKLSMVVADKGLRLAGRGELGNHFVKFPGNYALLPENEFAMMQIGALAGLTVPPTALRTFEELGRLPSSFGLFQRSSVYVVQRFDRLDDGSVVHIEDFNQIANQWPEQKYERASYESLGRTILTLCGEADFLEYVRRVAFNLWIGNEDAHLKNWSVVYANRRTPRLSPAYDLVSTVVYPGLRRETGLKIGGQSKAQAVDRDTFRRLARKAGWRNEDTVVEVVVDSIERARGAQEDVLASAGLPEQMLSDLREYQSSLRLLA